MKTLLVCACLCGALGRAAAQDWTPPIREVAYPGLDDFAKASADQFGFVIYYNPLIVQQAGPLVSAWVEAHEYAHIALGHVTEGMLAQDPYTRLWLGRKAELEADDYATERFADECEVIEAVIRYFKRMPNPGDATHLPSALRIKRIQDGADCEEEEPHQTMMPCPNCVATGHPPCSAPYWVWYTANRCCPMCGGLGQVPGY